MKTYTLLLLLAAAGCGVRGDPIPPGRPSELGRGKPTYRRATEGMSFRNVPGQPAQQDQQKEDDEETEPVDE